eukprot:scpid38452/ scgid8334/ Transcription factor SOX-8
MDPCVKIEMPHIASHDDAADQRAASEHVKRPMNAFMVWAKTERRKLAMKLPGIPNSEVSKLLGDMWRSLTDEEKDKYRGQSEKIRVQHKKDNPGYRYHPNRPRKQRALDSASPMATSLIQSSKHQAQRSLTPTASNPRLMSMQGSEQQQHRPHSAPPAYQQQEQQHHSSNASYSSSTSNGSLRGLSSVPVSQWWSPASTPPTSTFMSNGQTAAARSPAAFSMHYQQANSSISMPHSPASRSGTSGQQQQDLSLSSGGMTAHSPSSAWLKQNSPADSHCSSSSKQRASPCLLPDNRHQNQSPLIGAASGNSGRLSSSLNSSSASVGIPTGGSLLPTFYDKNPVSYMTQEQQQPVRTADLQPRFTGLVSTPKATVTSAQVSPTYGSGSVAGGIGTDAQRTDSILQSPATTTLFYPAAYQPTAYLPQPATYSWLLPEQIANSAPHNQMYHQQSVAS